jgi:hypothetical protein
MPSAALNKDGMGFKIAKIICLNVAGVTLEQGNYSNLHLLATEAQKWVICQFDKLCDTVTAELERKTYAELFAMEGISYRAPAANDVHTSRKPR